MNDLFTQFTSGVITHVDKTIEAGSVPWTPHPDFTGVKLKHLVKGSETDGRISVHLVKLDAGAQIGNHTHETSWELHEIAGGSGHCVIDGKTIPYAPGVVATLPENREHHVQAGDEGLLIMAKFIPALL